MTTKPRCKCGKAVKSAGKCQRCRAREIHGSDVVMTHTVGEVQDILLRIHDHYPTAREAIASTEISVETFYRIMRSDQRKSLKTTVYQKIMAAAEVLNGPPIESDPGAVSWAEAAEFATTPEGRMFVARCRNSAW